MVQMLQVTQRDFERTVINILKNLAQKGRPHVWREGEFPQGDGHSLASIIYDEK